MAPNIINNIAEINPMAYCFMAISFYVSVLN